MRIKWLGRAAAWGLVSTLAGLSLAGPAGAASASGSSGGDGATARTIASLQSGGVIPNFQFVGCSSSVGPRTCSINEPTVNRASTTYTGVFINAGEHVQVFAGGCVQTGGHGLTWKRYVEPVPDAGLYYGTISVPGGTGLIPLRNVVGSTLVATISGFLQLGYVDDGYSDNGYTAHDNGTQDQCKNVENAWVQLNIR